MQIQIQDRAKVSLRSLRKQEQKKITATLKELAAIQPESLYTNAKLRRLASKLPSKKMYTYQVEPKNLSLIISAEGDTYTLEDIMDSDRLNYLISTPQE